jgi:AraC family transcriptional regulator, L-rhamnose operon transcriptional activator RhaR
MALPKRVLEDHGRDPSSAVHRLAAVYIPPDGAVGIFDALHFTTTPWHFHDFYELAIVKSGNAYHVSDRGIEPVERGTVIFVPPGVGHEYRLCEDIRVYNCLFRADLADGELLWAFRDDHLRVLFDPLPRPGNKRGREIVNVQLDEAQTRSFLAALEPIDRGAPQARTRAGQVGHLLLALDVVATAARAAGDADASTPLPSSVATARALIEDDVAFPWTLTELSRQTYVGPTHLARSFARSLGMPPMHYLTQIRAERAAVMLTRTDDTVASIGAAVGWPDPAYFSRRFRAVYGISPREFRHRQRAGGIPARVERIALRG